MVLLALIAIAPLPICAQESGRASDTADPDAACPAPCPAFEMEFVRIPEGTFLMGSPRPTSEARAEGSPLVLEETPQHERSVGEYWLGKYEVTQAQWQSVMGEPPRCLVEECETCPVACLSWNDIQDFIERLNDQEPESRYRYRLPTEAEWEYAARAGTTGARYGKLDEIAWYRDNSGGRRQPVGQKRANAWGLHDMLGNVWEQTSTGFRPYPGNEREFVLPESYRVIRGGGWGNTAPFVRAAVRYDFIDQYSGRDHATKQGFRLVRTE